MMKTHPIDNHSAVINKMSQKTFEITLRSKWYRILLLSILAGAFITLGAIFSVLLAGNIESSGVRRLIEGFGFSAGFFMVIISGGVLFTEANVLVPISLLHSTTTRRKDLLGEMLKFWILAFFGNAIGAFTISYFVIHVQHYPADVKGILEEIISFKLSFYRIGSIHSWLDIVLSGIFANWLVGMAAFLSELGSTIIDKYIPILLIVSIFVAANFQHSPANMAYFGLLKAYHEGPDWITIFLWNIIPAGIGNIIGGFILVALPIWYLYAKKERS